MSVKFGANLLERSEEQGNYSIAKKEWSVTGIIIDYFTDFDNNEDLMGRCELCGKESLRWHYEIENTKNGDRMYVGSKCIKQFDIPYYDEQGCELSGDEKDKRLAALLANKKRNIENDEVIHNLRGLYRKDKKYREYIKSAAEYYKAKNGFKALQLATIFWRFTEHQIDVDKKKYKVRIKSNEEKSQIREIPAWRLQNIIPSLNPKQRALCHYIRQEKQVA
ncbi:hypothetical protein EV201_0634 [Ancylomarina subtilis]|uniref:Uncharacterized protein n=1 Tax=Ancylomarina subtilis TaxID=1639035 RepID=A0A4V2FSX9_9BACT|nr:hypothetical protein [Ancylomarina subtilis]RZT96005.1 hypothetical protein EV201_0634 [Ancylomarina subtilis]